VSGESKNTEDLKALMQENPRLTILVKKNTDLLEEIPRHVTALSGDGDRQTTREDAPSP